MLLAGVKIHGVSHQDIMKVALMWVFLSTIYPVDFLHDSLGASCPIMRQDEGLRGIRRGLRRTGGGETSCRSSSHTSARVKRRLNDGRSGKRTG